MRSIAAVALSVALGSTGLAAVGGRTVATASSEPSLPAQLSAAEIQQACLVTDSSDLHAAGAQTTIDLSKGLPGQPMRLVRAVPNQYGALSTVPSTGPGDDGPGSAADCQWVGPPTTPTPPYNLTTVTVDLAIVPWSTDAVARQAWDANAEQYPPTVPGAGSPPAWSIAGLGDAAAYSGPGPLDDQVVLDVLDGTHTFSISLSAIGTVFNQSPPPWLTLAKAVIAQLAVPASPAPPAGSVPPPATLPPGCQSATGGPGVAAAHQLGDSSSDWFATNLPGTTVEDSQLTTPRDAASFFNALDQPQVQNLVTWVLRFDDNNQPLYPTMWNLLKADLESCLLTETFVHRLVTNPNDNVTLTQLYRNIADDPPASVGLMEPMTADDILGGLEGHEGGPPDPYGCEYCRVAESALASDITSLLAEGKDFTLPVAVTLNYLAALGFYYHIPLDAGGKGAKPLAELSDVSNYR